MDKMVDSRYGSVMPLVLIRYKPSIDRQTLIQLQQELCSTLAHRLLEQSINVTPQMVKIRYEKASELDRHMPDLFLEIEVRNFLSREPEDHAIALGNFLAPLLPSSTTFAVWFKICHASWHASNGQKE